MKALFNTVHEIVNNSRYTQSLVFIALSGSKENMVEKLKKIISEIEDTELGKPIQGVIHSSGSNIAEVQTPIWNGVRDKYTFSTVEFSKDYLNQTAPLAPIAAEIPPITMVANADPITAPMMDAGNFIAVG